MYASVEASTTSTNNWDDFSVIFNYQDEMNCSFNETNNDTTNGIFKVSNGVVTQFKDFTSTIQGGTVYKVTIINSSAGFNIYINGTLLGGVGKVNYRIGLGTLNNGATFDNLLGIVPSRGMATIRWKSADPSY
jgi:hypothetical protein